MKAKFTALDLLRLYAMHRVLPDDDPDYDEIKKELDHYKRRIERADG